LIDLIIEHGGTVFTILTAIFLAGGAWFLSDRKIEEGTDDRKKLHEDVKELMAGIGALKENGQVFKRFMDDAERELRNSRERFHKHLDDSNNYRRVMEANIAQWQTQHIKEEVERLMRQENQFKELFVGLAASNGKFDAIMDRLDALDERLQRWNERNSNV
jgi:ElaB/YqjD/DUF883 family membrane-anchored ribosome-binding protein